MEGFKKLMDEQLAEFMASDKPKAMLDKHIAEAFNESLKSVFGWNSEFRKTVERTIAAFLPANIDDVADIHIYNEVLSNMIKKHMKRVLSEDAAQAMERLLNDPAAPAPESVSIEALGRAFLEECEADDEPEIKISYSDNEHVSEFAQIDFSKGEYRGCGTVGVKGSEEVFCIHRYYSGRKDTQEMFPGPFYNFEKRLFHLYACGAKLTGLEDVDVDDLISEVMSEKRGEE
ncbi:MAG: hypothetical protein ACK5JO_08430 [Halodesulfovibrio sp.]